MSTAARTLLLFPDLEPAPVPVVASPVRGVVLPLFPDLDLGPVRPAPRPRAPRSRRVALPLPGQLPLSVRVVLALHPDVLRATRGVCLGQQDECAEVDCRHHLGAVRAFDGAVFGCSVAVALAYPHGIAPLYVADLLGVSESEAQRVERAAYGTVRVALQRLANEESERATTARRRRIVG